LEFLYIYIYILFKTRYKIWHNC